MSATARDVVVIVAPLVIIAIIVFTARRWRRGGLGPPIKVAAVTQAARERTNASYERHGWAKPYDDDGRMLPSNERTPPPQ